MKDWLAFFNISHLAEIATFDRCKETLFQAI